MFREAAKSIVRNTSVMLYQNVITTVSGVVLLVFVPRYLGPVEYGRLYLAVSITGMFQVLVNYGNNYLVAKNVARAPENAGQIVSDALGLRLILAIISFGLMMAFGALAGYPAEVQMILFVNGLSLVVWAVYTSLYACYQGREAMRYTSLGAILEKVSVCLVAISALMVGAGATHIAIIIGAGNLLNVLVLLLRIRNVISSFPRINWQGVRSQVRDGLPYFLFGVFGVIYYKIDGVMLSKMSTEEVVGWYGAAYRLFECLNFPYILTMALYPVLSRLWKQETSSHYRAMQKSLEAVVLVGVAVMILGIGLARPIIGLFYGLKAFAPTVLLFQLLLGGIIFLYVDMILGTALLSIDKQKQMMVISLLAIPLNVGLNAFMIPWFETSMQNGAIGAAASTGITEVVFMLLILRMLPREMLREFHPGVVVKGLVAGTAMAGVLVLASAVHVHWIVAGILSLLTFGSLLIALRVLEPEELKFIRGLMTVKGLRMLHGVRVEESVQASE